MWDIKAAKEQLGPEICACILFWHAIIRCDTPSHLYSIGKGTSLKKFISRSNYRDKVKVFNANPATPMDIAAAGEEVLLSLYNWKQGKQLDSQRYKHFCEKVTTNA